MDTKYKSPWRLQSLLKFSCVAIVLLALLVSEQLHMAQGAAVMSVDLGSEWMKVGVVSPGVPMEIALNRESKRKTPALISFRKDVRTFGEDAVTVGIREPSFAYGYLLDLLGKEIDNPVVELYRKRFPYYEIIGDPERNTIIFKKSDEEQFSVEELIAQMLVKAKEFAQESTAQPVSECVITVPGFFGQAEREALLAAAQLANLKVLQLINDYTAVALNYGVFHRGEMNETAQYFVFYDMGAYKTSAALVSYQLVKDKATREISPVVQVLGVGYDRTLGGLDMQLRLRDYLAAEFNALKKTKTDVTTSPRALAKLFKEAGRVKNVLSANNEHYAQIENLIDDQDFKLLVTREKLEELCADLWPRAVKPLEQAIATSGLSFDVVSQVIIFGGATRVPRVQETLKQLIKQELGKSLNADEAAAMGAVYKAADLSAGFKVKKFIVKDATVFPLQVSFERDPGDGGAIKQVKRVLFSLMNPYPQKKAITFNKNNDDFEFYVHYGDLEQQYSKEEIRAIGKLNISTVALRQVKQLLEQSKPDLVESKGIKAYFYLDDSGVIRCNGVEYVYEKQQSEQDNGDDDSTLAKLGSTISKLFTKDKEFDDKKSEEDQKKEGTDGDDTGAKDDANKNAKDNESTKTDEPIPEEKLANEKEKNETVKLVTVKTAIPYTTQLKFTAPLAGEAYEKSSLKLQEINNVEQLRNRLESAFNALESHVIEVQHKLGEESYESCATAEEKEKLLAICETISEWLYDHDETPTPALYENKLLELRKLSNVFLARHWEHEERPDAVKAINGMLEGAQKFLDSARNLTKDTNPEKDVFTQVEVDTLSKVIDETTAWLEAETTAQDLLERNADVRLAVKDITDKMALLDREVKYLVNKLKIWKPKVKPTKKDKKKKKEQAETKANATNEETGSGAGDGEQAEKPSNAEQEEEVAEENPDQQAEEPETVDSSTTTNEQDENISATPAEQNTPHSEL